MRYRNQFLAIQYYSVFNSDPQKQSIPGKASFNEPSAGLLCALTIGISHPYSITYSI